MPVAGAGGGVVGRHTGRRRARSDVAGALRQGGGCGRHSTQRRAASTLGLHVVLIYLHVCI